MQRGNVFWLQVDGALVISLRLLVFAQFVPAEGAVVVCFEMIWINLNGIFVVFDCAVEFPLFPISKSTIMVEVGLARLDGDRLRKAFDCLIIVPFPI